MNEKESIPAISITDTEGNQILLHRYNCLMRIFNDDQYNHIELYDDEEETIKGLMVGQAVMDLMFEMEFSWRYDAVPDESTVNWYINAQTHMLDKELDDL